MSSKPKNAGKAESKGGEIPGGKNEGEGNRTAARHYNKDTRDFVESGKVGKSADKARKAVEGDERKELKRAEQQGMKPARH
jgi:hypothetical protein